MGRQGDGAPHAGPWVLGLNTASPTLAAALAVGGDVVIERYQHPTTGKGHHAEHLMPMVDEICRVAEVAPAQLAAIAVALGPGGFTGVRTSLAAAKAASLALGVPLIGVSTLEALAEQSASGPWIATMVEARQGDVFAALYRRDAAGLAVVLEPGLAPFSDWLARLEARVPPQELVFIGDGALRHGEAIAGRWPGGRYRFEDHLLRAAAVARLGTSRLARADREAYRTLEPIYLREPSATPNPARLGGPGSSP